MQSQHEIIFELWVSPTQNWKCKRKETRNILFSSEFHQLKIENAKEKKLVVSYLLST